MKYYRALINEEWQIAESCWLPPEVEKSKRLGITFTGIDAKYDCTSPIVNSHLYAGKSLKEIKTMVEYMGKDMLKISILACYDSDTLSSPYFMIKTNGKWYICSALCALTQEWDKKLTEFTNVYYKDPGLVNEYALKELDKFIESLGEKLEIPPERMTYLKQAKIDYYLCNKVQIKQLTGHDPQGMTNFQFDAIVSRHLPHTHELVHLMMNYSIGQLPLYTLPLLQEGSACYLGGRWGKTPRVILYWGSVSLELGLGNLDDILTFNGFFRGTVNSDVSYALSSIHSKFLIERFGMEKYKMYYFALSGDSRFIGFLTSPMVKSTAVEIFGTRWAEIQEGFEKLSSENRFCGITPVKCSSNKSALNLVTDNLKIRIFDLDTTYYFHIELESDEADGVVLFTDKEIYIGPAYRSSFFIDHLPGVEYNNEMYGLKFSAGEVGFYNYFTNFLLGKYVLGFSPSDDYWDKENRIITFALDKTLLIKHIGEYEINLVELSN